MSGHFSSDCTYAIQKDMWFIKWGMNAKDLGFIVKKMSVLLIKKFKNGLEFDTRQFLAENCEHFAKAIYKKTKTYSSVIGFIDGILQKLCCPKSEEEQKTLYNG
ncbi:hypothetical protein PHYBLDRAFT_165347 [Phycomyces blakesleeanus NRRL 1555(-)]|uniref:Uncharacterized protein n=1 Tax=Phycomyces blakesleeanus (strain ATCC 8743b / DSM 1359 / FGSC 10004 / NBRC 33097 / NRRL 1555) TaxID=763407 RepID=A0A162PX90_PHYB8|nr:hypothetical protein PHYBLDRAFT_165347 [Phycomyces blakesleeanus NRRL 1555(-)]OAD76847.1 hypothetical protein PHYBLDRAFT_165347 [Phycomyces blakesleeanus NRRL 1555(-)]|eukprot:XP_018294887.1 hypothetical protein PHYBLDRAFT_165347 [Phycomyces blakesleeanus NRRL 1555(-)]